MGALGAVGCRVGALTQPGVRESCLEGEARADSWKAPGGSARRQGGGKFTGVVVKCNMHTRTWGGEVLPGSGDSDSDLEWGRDAGKY